MTTRRSRDRGFTLVELMVSLVAGLIVTIAVVGLARAATTTFFEAARISSVEATVRTASERLRQDLSRASYMSTGNIRLARDQAGGVPLAHRIAVPDPTTPSVFGGSRYTALNDLAGINIIVGGSGAVPIPGAGTAGPNALSSNNGLNPDAVILGGNFTTNDSYQGTFSVTGGTCPGGQAVTLNSAADAAVRRLLTTADPLASLQAAFTPVIVPITKFAARVVDGKGCQHYVVVCGVALNATGAVISIEQDTGSGPAVLLSGAGNHTNCGATDAEPVTINPVQRVRWYIGPNVDATLDPASGVEVAGNKFNMYRDFIDAGAVPTPIVQMRQVVAEYAADLKFGIGVADATNTLQVFDMDDVSGNITSYTQTASTTVAGQPGPQRVRSVRFRVATRAAVPDRTASLVVGPPPYLTRYCVQNQPPATCKSFARVRTVVSEVALMNQIGMTY
ncbi:MAG TPA: prepilin-type N-terminal cleavage/methylation domain-containing protein [Labilithrix sp.]|nr:prepilin-type N-terminal cleavage/methylation domain-containing protein [Labilithrix sp.]